MKQQLQIHDDENAASSYRSSSVDSASDKPRMVVDKLQDDTRKL